MVLMVQHLETAWKSAQDKSGLRKPSVTDQKKSKAFFAAFEKSTGIRKSQIVGMYLDWLRLPEKEKREAQARRSASVAFCAYMVDRIERTVGAAGMAIAAHGVKHEV